MVRRPFLLLSLMLLGAALAQAAVTTLVDEPASSGGKVCTACGPIR